MTTRRGFLAAAAGLAASVALPRGGTAATGQPATAVPRTFARGNNVRDGLRAEAASPLSHLAVRWTGPGAAALRLRTRSGWTAAAEISTCDRGRDRGGVAHGGVVVTAGAIGYELIFRADPGDCTIVELNTASGPAAHPVAWSLPGTASSTTPVRYLSRAAWGADETLRFQSDGTQLWPPEYFPVQTLTVHHTASANGDPDPTATVRAIYHYDAVVLGWGDLGYHLLIDEAGVIYEGRWSGGDANPVFGGPSPGAAPWMVNAGHVAGFNAGNIGVALIGDFTAQPPTAAALASLTTVLGTLAATSHLDPLATVLYANPISGSERIVNAISGHGDWLPTQCPGDSFSPYLPVLRRAVDAH